MRLACDAFGPERVTALHINHGLSAQAGQWQDFCQRQAEQLGCQLKTHAGSVASAGNGLEAAARDLRYQQFGRMVTEDGVPSSSSPKMAFIMGTLLSVTCSGVGRPS